MNKILLFTHKSDIDGMGEIILSKIAFGEIDYIMCTNVDNLGIKIMEEYNKGTLYNYETIYITDLSVKKDVADILFNDEKIKDRIFLFDHHASAIEEGLLEYKNCTIKVEDEKEKLCATQIFYEYLKEKGFISSKNIIDEFVELVRREDTYDWKKLGDFKANELAMLFNEIGPEKFVKRMLNKINKKDSFEFDEEETEIIEDKKKGIENAVQKYTKYLKLVDIDGIKVDVCFIEYEYRNFIAEYLAENNRDDADAVMMIAMDNDQISIRCLKGGSYARQIAEKFGGGGHDRAAAISINDKMKDEIIDLLLRR